ncbi:fumarylacetoacetate hydrolase family protein [Paenibacillus daejeonensis]|uniref:fumarylacetoacetate hydrolase family protein n=1 Tax=Paenibacillus daejeonensis TaxID=135193 RepID=UPI0004762BE8|nr:fumarylacetoacetate hydrolase family protein [Paenibacillus daejeonensis]
MTISIQNVYCVGRNYGKHAAELGNSVPESPMIFMKPTHAITFLDEGRLEVPGTEGDVHYETELVVRIGQSYEEGLQAEAMISHYSLGLDLTLRDVQTVLKEKQHPWLRAKGFRHSAPITAFAPFSSLDALLHTPFSLRINQEERQRGSLSEAIFGLQVLIDHIGQHYGLGEGDLIFTGTPAGVGKLADGDRLELYWNDRREGGSQVHLTY